MKHISESEAPVILKLIENSSTQRGIVFKNQYDNLKYEFSDHSYDSAYVLEELVKSLYTAETGNEVFAAATYEHPEYKWMSATPGGWIEVDDGEYILECQIEVGSGRSELLGEGKKKGLVESYWVQLQHKMEVACANKAIVASLIMDNATLNKLIQLLNNGVELDYIKNLCQNLEEIKFRIIEVDKDRKFIEKLLCVERRFWEDTQFGTLL